MRVTRGFVTVTDASYFIADNCVGFARLSAPHAYWECKEPAIIFSNGIVCNGGNQYFS